MTRLKYDKEFKQTIVDLLSVDKPKSIDEVCKEYGIEYVNVAKQFHRVVLDFLVRFVSRQNEHNN